MRRKIFGRSSTSPAPDVEQTDDQGSDKPSNDVSAEQDVAVAASGPEITEIARPGEVESQQASASAGLARALAERDLAVSERDTAFAERDLAVGERDAALSERDAARTDCEIATAELHAAIVEGNSLRSKLVATGGFAEPRSNLDADDLLRAATLEAHAIRAEAQAAAERIIELAQERASTVHRNAEAEFRERIRLIAADQPGGDTEASAATATGAAIDFVSATDADLAETDAPEITHVIKASQDHPPPPPPLVERPKTKSFESLWEAASSVDDSDLERFFSEELERSERRALFES